MPTPSSPSNESSSYEEGHLIGGKYELIRQIGEGAMGNVWIAHNQALDVDVAIKLVRMRRHRVQAQRLVQEARAAAKLVHPSIVRVYDFGTTDRDDPFVAMELLQGEELADLMDREGRIDAVRAVRLMLPIADALATAHAKEIVHRDFKPENVMLANEESGRIRPKLLDFGIAKVASSARRRITLAGAVVGTPDYMSPEQANGVDTVDHRCDVWAFCVVLYELVAGRRPFRGTSYTDLLRAIVQDEPVPLTELAAGDPALWEIVNKGLAKNRDERWESMHAVGEALALWAYKQGVREDVCATSLKTSWLSSPRSGIPIELPPSRPPPPPPSGSALATPPPSPVEVETIPPGRPTTRDGAPRRSLDAPITLDSQEVALEDEPSHSAAVLPKVPSQRPARTSRHLLYVAGAVFSIALATFGYLSQSGSGMTIEAGMAPQTVAAGAAKPAVNPPPTAATAQPAVDPPAPLAEPTATPPSTSASADPAQAPSTLPAWAQPPSDKPKAWKKPGLAPADYEFGF